MKRSATKILARGNLPTNATDFLMASALTGALLTGDSLWANKYWHTYKTRRFSSDQIPIFFQVLEAQIKI